MFNECLCAALAGTGLQGHIFPMGMRKRKKIAALALLAGSGAAFAQAPPPIQPLDLPAIQGQYNSTIQQQDLGTQLNTFRIEQGVTRDRIRELDLFRPQMPFGTPNGATGVFLPQPSGVAPLAPYQPPALPPLSKPPALP